MANFTVAPHPRLIADDATPEAVSRLLAEQHGRLMIASTEGGIFDIIGGRYSDGTPNLDVYLKAYSGDTIRVDRANRHNRPPEIVPNACLTAVLTVQPSVIVDLAEKRTFRGRGFLPRWLYSIPKSKVGYRDIDPPSVEAATRQRWNQVIRHLLDLPLPDSEGIPLLTLSKDAAQQHRSFRGRIENDLRPGQELDDLADWGNKLAGTVARLAALLHIVDGILNLQVSQNLQDTPISGNTMRAAIELGEYFEVHAKAAFALMGADAGVLEAKRVWSVIS